MNYDPSLRPAGPSQFNGSVSCTTGCQISLKLFRMVTEDQKWMVKVNKYIHLKFRTFAFHFLSTKGLCHNSPSSHNHILHGNISKQLRYNATRSTDSILFSVVYVDLQFTSNIDKVIWQTGTEEKCKAGKRHYHVVSHANCGTNNECLLAETPAVLLVC